MKNKALNAFELIQGVVPAAQSLTDDELHRLCHNVFQCYMGLNDLTCARNRKWAEQYGLLTLDMIDVKDKFKM